MQPVALTSAIAAAPAARLAAPTRAHARQAAPFGASRVAAAASWTSVASISGVRAAPSMRASRATCTRAAFKVYAADAEEFPDFESDAMERMEKTMDATMANMNSIRTGRANAAILDRIEVEYYDTMTPLNQIAGISTPDAQTLSIQPFDMSALPAIEKAIMTSDIGITPSNDGKKIRLNIPPLTAERRKELAKKVSSLGEDGKVAIRNVRKDIMKKIGSASKDNKYEALSEDGKKELEDNVQKLTDDYVKQVDELVKKKEGEIIKV